MELESVKTIRQRYRDLLAKDATYNATLEELVKKEINVPVFTAGELNEESDLHYANEQRQLSEILLDMHAVNNGITEVKNRIDNTIKTIDDEMASVLESVRKQKEQVEDTNILCGRDSVYSAVLPIYTSSFEDLNAETLNDKTIGAIATESRRVHYDIVSIAGNGYSGNAFVYNEGEFENLIRDASQTEYILDDNDLTIYEYSRLCTRDKKEVISGVINYDDKEVECAITLMASQAVCKAIIQSLDPNLILRKVETSDDGLTYTTRVAKDLYINKNDVCYQDSKYAYGSAVICFPYSYFIRLTFASDTPLQDKIAIEKEDSTIQEVNAYRKKIALQGIRLFSSEYKDTTIETLNILEDSSVDKVSLFVSEYIPDHFPPAEYISYSLIINGQEHPVVPVNTGRDGITIVKFSEEEYSLNGNTELIHETIKTIRVKIRIRPYNNTETPYVSNIKVCIGKNTGNIYVESVS